MGRDEFIAFATDAGWAVTGHRWLRLVKDDKQIEIWFAGETPRMVSATLRTMSGGCERLNLVRDRAAPLLEAVLLWVATAHPLVGLQLMTAVTPTASADPAPPVEIITGNGQVAGNVALLA